MTFTSFINFILALPKLWQMFQSISKAVKQAQEANRQQQAEELQNAKTEEEIKNEARDYLKS